MSATETQSLQQDVSSLSVSNNNNNNNNTNTKQSNTNNNNNKNNNNNNNNSNNSSSNDKNQESDDDIKLNTDKNGNVKTASSYYLYRPTPKEEAEKFKPKKLDETPTTTINNNNNTSSSTTKGSQWNPGNTMEEFDYSQFVKDRLKELILGMKFENNIINIDKIDEMEGTATILFVRGKLKYGYDLHFKITWKGKIDEKEVEGTISMAEICPEDDSDEWEYEVKCKSSSSNEGKKALKIVKNEKTQLIKIINNVINEFKAKKQ